MQLIKVGSEELLTLSKPASHVGSALTQVDITIPVLRHLAEKQEISDGNFVACYKLLVLQEVVFDDIQCVLHLASSKLDLCLIGRLTRVPGLDALEETDKQTT